MLKWTHWYSFKNIYLFIWLCWVLSWGTWYPQSSLWHVESLDSAYGIFSCGMQTLSCTMWDLVPWPGIKSGPPALGAQSLSHWTTKSHISGTDIQWTCPKSALFLHSSSHLYQLVYNCLISFYSCLLGFLAPLPFWLKFNTLCFQYVYWNYEACKLYWGLGLVVSDKRSLVHRTLHLFCSFCSSSFPFSPQLWGEFIYSFPSCLKDLQIPFPLLNRAIFLFLWGLHSPHWILLPQLLSQQKLFSPLKEL